MLSTLPDAVSGTFIPEKAGGTQARPCGLIIMSRQWIFLMVNEDAGTGLVCAQILLD